ncbi:MAG: TonB-dependent receptor [Gemmatimonadota bacterium]
MKALVVPVCLLVTAAAAHAQSADSVLPLDRLVVTAARREQLLKNVVVATQIVTRHELVESGAASVADALQRRGLQLEPGLPGGQSVLIHGLGGPRLLVLLDGRPMIGNVGGTVDLSRIPADLIDRIEVVTGPQSTLYGSAAMAGVINLITRRPSGQRLAPEIALTAGSQERLDVHAATSGTARALAYRIEGGRQYRGLATGVSNDDATFARRWDGNLRLEGNLSSAIRASSRLLLVDEVQRYRIGQLYRFVDRAQADASIAADWEINPSHQVELTVHGSHFTHLARASTAAQPASAEGDDDEQRLIELSALYNGELSGTLVDAGIDLRQEGITADRVTGGGRSLALAEPFAQATWQGERWSLVPGVRVSLSDRWGERVTPRLAALVRPLDGLSLRGSWSQGFRAPDFKELYIEFVNSAAGYAVSGNPDLRPESSSVFALDIEWLLGRVSAHAGLHHTSFRDFIETGEQDATGTFTYGNIARGSIAGIDADLRARLQPLQFELGYAYLNTRDQATDTPLLGSAAHVARASAITTVVDTNVEINALYTGETPLQRNGAVISQWRSGWTSVNARVARTISGGVTASFNVHNALDRRMGADWPGFTGRQFSLRLAWSSNIIRADQ